MDIVPPSTYDCSIDRVDSASLAAFAAFAAASTLPKLAVPTTLEEVEAAAEEVEAEEAPLRMPTKTPLPNRSPKIHIPTRGPPPASPVAPPEQQPNPATDSK
eukprot:CAMPEP_0178597970 /NCGR_PEP_ID=MMETSP0697-20121206/32492_1 /TAXON_ID=265572 /ORGANISM="Extubocellulus spinifer, Strain CCMP396" /LENGTH=101 /DNA_ID=CAMNT_0020235705 /DNA_START=23 /DNA_END=328 /DNA_ORIENTATION=+